MTPRIPLNEFQKTLPNALPRHMRRRIYSTERGCWICDGAKSHGRYQSVSVNNKSVLAHRLSYSLLIGKIPEGYHIDHLCREKWCVNPDHLEAVPQRVNWERGKSTSVINARREVCRWGHPLEGDNLYVRPDGRGRQCRKCASHHDKTHRSRREGA